MQRTRHIFLNIAPNKRMDHDVGPHDAGFCGPPTPYVTIYNTSNWSKVSQLVSCPIMGQLTLLLWHRRLFQQILCPTNNRPQ